MTRKELMIGDWMNFPIDITGGETEYDSQTTEYQPMQIVSISAWANNDGEVESGEGVICDIEQLKPIPLTREILEKNGFVKNKYGEMTLELDNALGTTEIVLVPSYDEVYYWWKVNNELITKIKSIHELQHALRLCEINKEIVV